MFESDLVTKACYIVLFIYIVILAIVYLYGFIKLIISKLKKKDKINYKGFVHNQLNAVLFSVIMVFMFFCIPVFIVYLILKYIL